MKPGKLIVFYGINNLGKTVQTDLLIKKLKAKKIKAEYLKYPVYKLKPTGVFINEVLRSGKKQKISEEELQMWYTLNRFQYEPELKKKLAKGTWVIAEDYVGTGLAWGWVKGADIKYLESMNKPLMKEDLAILFTGKRFLQGKEKKHLHESNDDLMEKCKKKHLALGKKYHWRKINANDSVENVAENIWQIIEAKFEL